MVFKLHQHTDLNQYTSFFPQFHKLTILFGDKNIFTKICSVFLFRDTPYLKGYQQKREVEDQFKTIKITLEPNQSVFQLSKLK